MTVHKEKGSVVNTLRKMAVYNTPFQFFLNGNINTSLNISELDMDEAYAFLLSNPHIRAYCHLPYTITLANKIDENDGYTQRSLYQYLTAVSRISLKGAVVHVGKSNNYSVQDSIEHMRENILAYLQYTNATSPLLLETPAGQGNELLTKFKDFMQFMDSIDDPRFGICMDTCHVFATGQSPGEYITKMMSEHRWISRLKLIHFNDSNCDFGSCVDSHARVGCGKISKEDFLQVAYIANIYGIPMVIE